MLTCKMLDATLSVMMQDAPSTMTRFRIFWEALDAVMVRRGLKPLDYEQAREWFDIGLEPDDVLTTIARATQYVIEASR